MLQAVACRSSGPELAIKIAYISSAGRRRAPCLMPALAAGRLCSRQLQRRAVTGSLFTAHISMNMHGQQTKAAHPATIDPSPGQGPHVCPTFVRPVAGLKAGHCDSGRRSVGRGFLGDRLEGGTALKKLCRDGLCYRSARCWPTSCEELLSPLRNFPASCSHWQPIVWTAGRALSSRRIRAHAVVKKAARQRRRRWKGRTEGKTNTDVRDQNLGQALLILDLRLLVRSLGILPARTTQDHLKRPGCYSVR